MHRNCSGLRLVWRGRVGDIDGHGEVSPYAALMTCLAATIGVGNIAGVATAIALGGPGAVFWMRMTALVGMPPSTPKSCSPCISARWMRTAAGSVARCTRSARDWARWARLGTAFARFGGLAGFGIGNMVQSNSIAAAMQASFGWSPTAIVTIVTHAFTPTAATGGFAGAAVIAAIRYGVARGIFSNEAGLGTAGIAQSAGVTSNPVRSGLIGMMGTFFDTLVVCSMTGIAIVVSGVWTSGETGAVLTQLAFQSAMPGIGDEIVAIALAIFALTTIFGWSFYGERCWNYLLGPRSILPFRVLWTIAVFLGAITHLDLAWTIADTLNALMAVPNLVALLALAPVVVRPKREQLRAALDVR
jgi:AGCS family alanine or glycine:cation symporter